MTVYGPKGPSSRFSDTCAIIHLGPASPPGSSGLPGAQTERAAPRPCLALLRMGVAWPAPLLVPPVVSYTTFSPWPQACARGGLFLWPCPRLSPPGSYPAPCPVERGLSSDCPSRGGPRSPGRPTGQSHHIPRGVLASIAVRCPRLRAFRLLGVLSPGGWQRPSWARHRAAALIFLRQSADRLPEARRAIPRRLVGSSAGAV